LPPLMCVLGLAVAVASPPKAHQLDGYTFQQYVSDFGKVYGSDEARSREQVFNEALSEIRAHNTAPGTTYKLGVNKFTDMTDAEKKAFKGKSKKEHELFKAMLTVDPPSSFMQNLKPVSELPASVDWRTHSPSVVTPTKNQGGCGSCWAFSATEVLESHVAIATGKLYELAPQQLVSCAPNPDDCGGTGGCEGSVQWLGFNYTATAGLSLETSYPYTATTGTCKTSAIKPVAGNTGYVRLPANNYTVLMNAVATLGPIAISVDAGWMSYESGVYTGSCGTTIDHAVVLVGYGTDKGTDYYLVRNSWGSSWGEDGYIRQLRKPDDSTNCGIDKDPSSGTECKPYPSKQKVCGLCGILSDSSYPTGAKLV